MNTSLCLECGAVYPMHGAFCSAFGTSNIVSTYADGFRAGQEEMRERAAIVADEFDFGLGPQAALVYAIRALAVKEKP